VGRGRDAHGETRPRGGEQEREPENPPNDLSHSGSLLARCSPLRRRAPLARRAWGRPDLPSIPTGREIRPLKGGTPERSDGAPSQPFTTSSGFSRATRRAIPARSTTPTGAATSLWAPGFSGARPASDGARTVPPRLPSSRTRSSPRPPFFPCARLIPPPAP